MRVGHPALVAQLGASPAELELAKTSQRQWLATAASSIGYQALYCLSIDVY